MRRTALLMLVILAGCSHQTGDDGATDGPAGSDPSGGLTVEEGTFWEFYWIETSRTTAQGSGTTAETDWGRIRFTLGEPADVAGTMLHAVERQGDTGPIPAWTHLGVDDTRLLGSLDGHTIVVVFDAAGAWTGGGFFSGGSGRDMTAGPGAVANDIVQATAYAVGYSHEEGGCTYYPETGTICDDESQRSTSQEHYKSGIGPLAFTSSSTFTYSGGGYYSAHEFETQVGLVDSSLSATDGWTPAGIPWTQVAPMPAPRGEPSVVAVEGRIYVIGGKTYDGSYHDHADVQVYDPPTDTWTSGRSDPSPYVWNTKAAAVGPFVFVASYAAGGTDDPDTLAAYDTRDDTWTTPEPMAAPLRLNTGEPVSIGPYFILVGTTWTYGATYQQTHVLIYDALEDEWIRGAALDVRLPFATAVALGHDVYVFHDDGDYRYNLTTGEWRPVGEGTGHVIGAAFDGRIHLFRQGERVKVYDPATDAWSQGPITAANTVNAAAVAVGDAIYVVGGTGGREPPEAYATGSVYRYHPQ